MVFEIDPVEDLQGAVDWFVEVVGPTWPDELALRPPTEADDVDRNIAEIERRIAPLELPAEIRWFWQTWDPVGFDLVGPTGMCHPDFALASWVGNLNHRVPRALFPIGYDNHHFTLVDLARPSGSPASVWSWGYFTPELTCEAPSLAAIVRSCAERAEAVSIDPATAPPGDDHWSYHRYLTLFHGDDVRATIDRHFAAVSHVRRTTVPEGDPVRWPAAWQEAERTVSRRFEARGRTHTVVEFRAALAGGDGHARGRLRGTLQLRGSGFSGGPHEQMVLTDDTGAIDLAVPPSRMPPGMQEGAEIEVEAVGRGPFPPHPTPPAGADLYSEARVAFRRQMAEYKAQLPLVERTDLVDP